MAAVVVLIVAACSNNSATTTSGTPTTTALPTTTITNPPLVDGGLISVDPATLIPLQGSTPILVADWFTGEVSPNGVFAAIQSLPPDSDNLRLSLIDLAADTVLTDVEMPIGVWDRPIVTDDGVVYWLAGQEGVSLLRIGPGDDDAQTLYADLPPTFSGMSLHLLADGRFGVFGASFDEHPEGVATLFLIAANASSHQGIVLENVTTGFANQPDPDATVQVFEFAGNAPVWDDDGDRFLLVEAVRDVVTEVDLSTGEVSEHIYAQPKAFLDQLWASVIPKAQAKGPVAGTSRVAVLAPDGRHLFVATSITETEVEETAWETIRLPQKLMIIDVDTWEASLLDIAVDALDTSPDGIHLLAHGATVTEGTSAGFVVEPTPVHVIDMALTEVLLGFQSSDTSAAEVQFSADGELSYISTLGQDGVTIETLDLGLLQLTGAVSFRELSLVGQAGYMAFHLK